MLKSSGRTTEVPVMGMEEWPQVVSPKLTMERRVRGNPHARCGVGERWRLLQNLTYRYCRSYKS